MKKKRQFHCAKCGSPCEIYKKGKGHRLFTCPSCGILASNPLPLAAIAAYAAPYLIEKGRDILTPKNKTSTPSIPSPSQFIHKETYSAEERVRDALR